MSSLILRSSTWATPIIVATETAEHYRESQSITLNINFFYRLLYCIEPASYTSTYLKKICLYVKFEKNTKIPKSIKKTKSYCVEYAKLV